MMTLLDKAVIFAANAHAGQRRKSTDVPYIVHPVEVMKIVSAITEDEEIRAAAVLHDTLEDTPTTLQELIDGFGSRVASLVRMESEQKEDDNGMRRPWHDRKQETIDALKSCRDPGVLIICLGDKLSNLRDIDRDFLTQGVGLWDRFNQKDKAEHAWYYRTICDLLKEPLENTAAWKEYRDLILRIFGE